MALYFHRAAVAGPPAVTVMSMTGFQVAGSMTWLDAYD
jgi:hypothetical protein